MGDNQITYKISAKFDDGLYRLDKGKWTYIGPLSPRKDYRLSTCGFRPVREGGKEIWRYFNDEVAVTDANPLANPYTEGGPIVGPKDGYED